MSQHAAPSQQRQRKQTESSGDGCLIALGIAAVGLLALPAAILMLLGGSGIKRWPRTMAALAIGGGLLFGLICWPQFQVHLEVTKAATRGKGVTLGTKLERLAGAAPLFWFYTLPLAPGAAYIYAFFRPRSVQEQHDEQQQRTATREARQVQRAQQQAAQAIPRAAAASGPDAALLGVFLAGDSLFLTRQVRELLFVNTEVGASSLHMLFLGENGSGKSESMFRVMASLAAATDWSIYYLDPKNDSALRQRFYSLMTATERRCRIFPLEDYNGWNGDTGALLSRIMAIPAYSDEGGAAYYQDMAEVYVRVVLDAWTTLPGSFEELEQRLDYATVKLQVADNPVLKARLASVSADDARSVAMRFRAMTPKLQAIRRSGWAFEETRAAYFGLPVLANARDSAAIATFILEDIKHYLAERSTPERRKVFFIDEFASLGTEAVIQLMEMARSYGGVLGLAVQTIAGLGDRVQQQRITGNVTLVLHRMSDAEELTRLAGVVEVAQITRHIEGSRDTKRGSVRIEDGDKVSPQSVRTLPTGVAWLIARGRAAKIAIAQAPDLPDVPLVLDIPALAPRPSPTIIQGGAVAASPELSGGVQAHPAEPGTTDAPPQLDPARGDPTDGADLPPPAGEGGSPPNLDTSLTDPTFERPAPTPAELSEKGSADDDPATRDDDHATPTF